MLSGSHEQLPQGSLEMKQDEKFFTRIMSKETSMANSSCRVYYGGASGTVPFLWESRPGTPKHTFSDTSIPPLTPPPSYYSSSSSISKSMHQAIKPNLFSTIFTRFVTSRNIKTPVSPSSSMTSTTISSSSSSSASSSSWSSSSQSSISTFKISKLQKRLCFSCSRSSIHNNDDDDDDNDKHLSTYTSSLRYYGNNKNEG